MYVISCLSGGLGNQLFQYAAARTLATRIGARLILDATRPRSPGGFGFVLGNFAIDEAEIISGGDWCPAAWGSTIEVVSIDRKILHGMDAMATGDEGLVSLPVFRERSFDYDSRIETVVASKLLVGFWQSEKYFLPAAATIRRTLRLKRKAAGANAAWFEEIRRATAVCIHVRRGDYTTGSAKTHGACSMSYFSRAMDYVRGALFHPTFFVFSDDQDWVRRNFKASDTVVVDVNGPEAADEDLRLMSACRHHIISNSSLGWWAAWLGEHESQIVIAPDPWFITGRPTPDLLPDRWLRLPRG